MGDGTVTSLRWRSDKRPATGGMVASNKMASVQKLQMFYHFKLFLFVAVFLSAERINCRQFNIILHHLGQIFFSEMCFPCTSHSMREEATTSIFSATYRPKSAQIFVKITAPGIGGDGSLSSLYLPMLLCSTRPHSSSD